MTINENKNFSKNRKKRIEQRIKIDEKMKSVLNKIRTQMKNENFVKNKELEIELVKIKYAKNPNKLQSDLKELNKNHVFNKNLHEFKNEILLDYFGYFEMVGNLKTGDQVRQTHI